MSRLRTAALVGNPNSGKSALFNALTGARQKIANYAGVTVERKAGRMFLPSGEPVELVDLPGSYALDAASPDEEVTRKVVLGEFPGEAQPEVLVIVLDASNIEQHLVFAQELIELGRPVVVALNMVDLAERDGLVIDPKALEESLGVPVIPTVAVRKRGLDALTEAIASAGCPCRARPALEAAPAPDAARAPLRRAPDGTGRDPQRDFGPPAARPARPRAAAPVARPADPVRAAVRDLPGGVRLGDAVRRRARRRRQRADRSRQRQSSGRLRCATC